MFKYYKNDKEFERDKQIEEMTRYLLNNGFDLILAKADAVAISNHILRKYQPKIPEDAVVLTREQYDNMFEYKTTRGGFFNILDTVRKVEREETVEKITKNIEELMVTPFEGKTDKQMLQRKGMEEGLRMALEICKEIMEVKDGK